MGVFYFLLLSCLGLANTAQAQECAAPPLGGQNMDLTTAIGSQTFPSGSQVTYTCQVGYKTEVGSGTITCTNGSWSNVTLKCKRKSCGSAGEVPNGDIHYEGIDFGDKMVITCNRGYKLVGRNEIICGDGKWLNRLPVCQVVSCDTPPDFVDGSFSPNKETYDYGQVITYKCLKKDYTLDGSANRHCSDNGEFHPDPPKCVKVNCEEPDIPNAKWVEGSRPPYGYRSTVRYECISGYKMAGSDTLTCQIDSQWSSEFPTCTRIITPTKAPTTAAPTTTTTTPTTTTRPYHTKKATEDGSSPEQDVNGGAKRWQKDLGIALGVLFPIGCLIAGYFGVTRFIKRKKKSGIRNGDCDKDAAEGLALS